MALQKQLFSNNAVSLLAAPITATSTSLQVLAGFGSLYPNPGPNEYFSITLEDQSASIREIIHVTGRSGDTFTFSLADRAQEGTTALAWSASLGNDTLVDHRITAAAMRNIVNDYENASFPALTNFTEAIDYLLNQTPATSGSMVFNQNYSLIPAGANTILQLSASYRSGSTCVYVGGLRQKLGIDYVESAPDALTLLYSLTPTMIADGQSITIDFVSE